MTTIVTINIKHLHKGKRIVVRQQPRESQNTTGGAPTLIITEQGPSNTELAVWDSNQLVITEEDNS